MIFCASFLALTSRSFSLKVRLLLSSTSAPKNDFTYCVPVPRPLVTAPEMGVATLPMTADLASYCTLLA